MRSIQFSKGKNSDKLDEILKNVLAENEKVLYDPMKGTNWCDLPSDTRIRCIEAMDFKTRACLRGTSAMEKKLTELYKYQLEKATMTSSVIYQNSILMTLESEEHGSEETLEWENREDRKLLFPKLVLQLAEIDHLTVGISDDLNLEELEECLPIRCKNLTLYGKNLEVVMFFLKNCREGVERIEVNAEKSAAFPLCDFVYLPLVINAKFVSIRNLHRSEYLYRLIENWIRNDAEIGRKLEVDTDFGPLYHSFHMEFEDRRIWDQFGPWFMRISTDNLDKEIVISFDQIRSLIICEVVPR